MNFLSDIKIIYERLLFPKNPECPICNKILFTADDIFCNICKDKLEFHSNVCKICGRELSERNQTDICLSCKILDKDGVRYFNKGISLFSFGKYSKKIVYSIKKGGRKGLGLSIGEFISEKTDEFKDNIDIIIPVPMYFKKESKRGFNQADLIAKSYAKSLDIPYYEDALIKLETKEQKTLPPVAREINIKSAVKINQFIKNNLKGKRILLVDDVYTTGATINTCAKTLIREADVKEVNFLTICSTKEIM